MIRFLVLLWILAKSTFTSFAGLASLPEIRDELVEQRQWITDEDLNQSIVITRTTPGPVGVYVVCVGYMADGIPGAIAGWIAMAAPSLLVVLLVGYFGKRAQHPRVRSMLHCVVLASAALLVLAAIPIGREALDGPLPIGIAAVALPLLVLRRLNSLWIIAAAAALSFTGSIAGVAHGHAAATGTSSRSAPTLAPGHPVTAGPSSTIIDRDMGPDVKHVHLAARDHAASQRFYEAYFGFRFDATFPRGDHPRGDHPALANRLSDLSRSGEHRAAPGVVPLRIPRRVGSGGQADALGFPVIDTSGLDIEQATDALVPYVLHAGAVTG